MLTSVEICAGAGGQALGLEKAGFSHQALVEIEPEYCATLKHNRPEWNVIQKDVREFSGLGYRDIDLLAGGVPCPPFSKAGKQLGADDERDLFPEIIRLAYEIRPSAILIENVKGLLDPVFNDYREHIKSELAFAGYRGNWYLSNASDFGVPQLRPRVTFVAIRKSIGIEYEHPGKSAETPTVGEALYDLMRENDWDDVDNWKAKASKIAPTIVGGSKKHGGPDLGPTRARKAWAELGVDGSGIAKEAPQKNFVGMPKLTNRMVARLQGFDDDWEFIGSKTCVYRQIGNAFPTPVAQSIGGAIRDCLTGSGIGFKSAV